MTLRLSLAYLLLAAAPALAQPAAKSTSSKASTSDDMAAFEKDLDALFVEGGLTSDQAATRAGPVSPTVHRRNAELEAAIATATAAELQFLPIVSGKAAYQQLSHIDPFVIPNPMNPMMPFSIPFLEHSYDFQASAVLPLSDFVLRTPHLVAAANAGEDAARAGRRTATVSAGQDARLAYYEWVRSKLQVLIARRQLTQVRTTLKQVRALAEVQRLSRAELLRVESQEAEAERTLDQLQNLADLREEQLRLLIGAREGEPLTVGEDIRRELEVPEDKKLDDLVERAQHKRLEFRVIDLGIAAKEKQRSAEVSNMLPRLSAFGTIEDANPNPRVFPQADKYTLTWVAGVQLTWTLNDILLEGTTAHRLRAEADELRADRENLLRGTRIEVLAADQAVQIAVHALKTTQKGLVAAEEGYRVRKELLNAERATAVELVDAETDLTRARIAALNARVDLRVALAQLAHAIGADTATAR
jgi:outer membrane protein TolC